jgi:hypothetical protein
MAFAGPSMIEIYASKRRPGLPKGPEGLPLAAAMGQ